ncbi:MAG: chemotaxis protein CheW [Pirellulales bacterium]|nr:chemotaxis protein CheW [Pirellulales bacterium]
MNALAEAGVSTTGNEVEFATFYIGDLLLAADIHQVREINRHFELTPVPHAPPCVRGVINLRGDVVTVVDLRTILGLGQTEIARQTRNVIVHSRDEQIGMLVDRVADTIRVPSDAVEPPPANVQSADASFFKGVYRLEQELIVLLDVDAALVDASQS